MENYGLANEEGIAMKELLKVEEEEIPDHISIEEVSDHSDVNASETQKSTEDVSISKDFIQVYSIFLVTLKTQMFRNFDFSKNKSLDFHLISSCFFT